MEKRNYVKPLLNSEEFVPQTYVAACIAIACDLGKGHSFLNPGIDENGGYHTQQSNGTGCGHATNQYIKVDENGLVKKIIEINTPINQGNLEAKLDEQFLNKTQTELAGKTITWETYGKDIFNNKVTYLHSGTFESSSQGSNHS